MRTVRYGIVPTLDRDSLNCTLKSLTEHCTVQCPLTVVVTRSLVNNLEGYNYDGGMGHVGCGV